MSDIILSTSTITLHENPGNTFCRYGANCLSVISRVTGIPEPFEEKMSRLTSELSELFAKSHELEAEIKERLGAIGYEV